jgi:Protein of unknown function (DUF3995)
MKSIEGSGNALAIAVSVAFMLIALGHFYMVVVPPRGENAAVPSVKGKPLFVPSAGATLVVALVLLGFAALTAATGSLVTLPLPRSVLVWLSYGLALGLLGRAIGEFKYVGFFKRVRDSRFARLDTFIYSPLCLLLAGGVALNALEHSF